MAGKSQAIDIDRNRGGTRDSTSSEGPFSPPPYSSSFGRGSLFSFQRSMSVASDGTAQNSPPNYYANDSFESPYAGRQRNRTYSFSGNSDEDGWSSSQLSTSAPGQSSWRRSNSVSYATDKNLGRIDEHSAAFPGFGNAIKKSMDKLFHPEQTRKMNFAAGMGGVPGGEKKKNGQVKDRVVSMLTSM